MIPEKWAINPKTQSESDTVRQWFERYRKYPPGYEQNYYWHFPPYNVDTYCYTSLHKNYKEISYSDFLYFIGNNEEITRDNLIYGVLYNVTGKYSSKFYESLIIFNDARALSMDYRLQYEGNFKHFPRRDTNLVTEGDWKFRKATEEEKEWFEMCKKEGGFLPKPISAIIDNYSTF